MSHIAFEEQSSSANKSSGNATKDSSRRKGKAWIANGVFVIYTHIIGIAALFFFKPSAKVIALTFGIWLAAGIGVTMGYHRLWSHRTFQATFPLRLILALLGTLGFQGSIKWWCERHRLHHRFTDTDHDPYNAKRGFWFSHMGWIFEKQYYPKLPSIDISDLTQDPSTSFYERSRLTNR